VAKQEPERVERSLAAKANHSFFSMTDQQDKQETAELKQLNAELTRSLARCRKLLFDCRSQLAANCNMPELLDDESGKKLG
jgi:hypothetical protein